ncbi:hypothetical protein VNI00_003201 [Paramarasmius palmivorus]|uniref:Uncharacterized protein n=1 Tax=Paramarasmius palmivorus TaxID=297713 RepID=A0AAW0DS76_9AGAR
MHMFKTHILQGAPIQAKGFLFIIGGYIGDPRQPEKWSSYSSIRFMTILMVDISQRTWQVLNTIGAAPARLRHAVACLGNEIYVFGGRSRLPDRYWEDDYNHDNDWICSPEEILDSYSVLRFDPDTSQWMWRVSEQSYPAHIKGLGFGVEALVMDSTGSHANLNTAKIFLTPGMTGDTEHQVLSVQPLQRHRHDMGRSYAGFHEVIPFTASPVYHGGYSDSVIFTVLGVNEDTYTFYYYRPPFNDEFRLLGDVDNTFTRKRRVGGTMKVGGPRVFVGCVAVGNKTYLLGKTREENELDTIAEISLKLDD